MVDAADLEKVEASKNELHSLIDKPQLHGIPVSTFIIILASMLTVWSKSSWVGFSGLLKILGYIYDAALIHWALLEKLLWFFFIVVSNSGALLCVCMFSCLKVRIDCKKLCFHMWHYQTVIASSHSLVGWVSASDPGMFLAVILWHVRSVFLQVGRK